MIKNNVNKVVESYLEKQGRIKGLKIVVAFASKSKARGFEKT